MISMRLVTGLLVVGLLLASAPAPARAESGVLDPNISIAVLVVVVGVLGWVAWRMEKEDEADHFQARAILPLHLPSEDAAFGFVFDPVTSEDARVEYTAGLAIGRRF
ncbi:MAG TPA: hypothetical protein PKE12_06340 [Kiritimatiellia bacterium]|nr:hypothetical protein [Kiritimatiellia bacterium]